MNGRYLFGLPFISISVNGEELEFLVDTGFNGSLLLPLKKIQELNLIKVATTKYALADGNIIDTEIFEADIEWFGKRRLPVVSSPSDFCLVGMELLRRVKTTLFPAKNIITIEPA